MNLVFSYFRKFELLESVDRIKGKRLEVGLAMEHFIKNVIMILDHGNSNGCASDESQEEFSKIKALHDGPITEFLIGIPEDMLIKMITKYLSEKTDYSTNLEFKMTDKMLEDFFSQYLD